MTRSGYFCLHTQTTVGGLDAIRATPTRRKLHNCIDCTSKILPDKHDVHSKDRLQIFLRYIVCNQHLSSSYTETPMALKPLFLDEKLIELIAREARKAGQTYDKFLSERVRHKPRVKTRTVTQKVSTVSQPDNTTTPFIPEKKLPYEPPTVDAGESQQIGVHQGRAVCGLCRGEVILPRTQLMTLRSRGRKIYCLKCKPISVPKSA